MCFYFIFFCDKKEMLKGSAYFLPFSSFNPNYKNNRYNDREEKNNFCFIYLLICFNDDEDHSGIP